MSGQNWGVQRRCLEENTNVDKRSFDVMMDEVQARWCVFLFIFIANHSKFWIYEGSSRRIHKISWWIYAESWSINRILQQYSEHAIGVNSSLCLWIFEASSKIKRFFHSDVPEGMDGMIDDDVNEDDVDAQITIMMVNMMIFLWTSVSLCHIISLNSTIGKEPFFFHSGSTTVRLVLLFSKGPQRCCWFSAGLRMKSLTNGQF